MIYSMGIDTSNYTTSIALMDSSGTLLAHERIPLEVPPGEKGIRQSKAFFYHMKNLPVLLERFPEGLRDQLVAITVSTRPRPVKGSYLPVFLAGEMVARSLATVLGCRLYETSHQEGHLMAPLWSLKFPIKTFISCHFSGGTTDIHSVKREGPKLLLELLGTSQDLYAGQFVDRIGVELGLSFPAGEELERLAERCGDGGYPLPVAVKGLSMSFSGPTSAAKRALEEGVPPSSLARGVENSILKTALKALREAISTTGIQKILLIGGVFCNQYITRELKESLGREGIEVFSTLPEYSRDGAVGQAFLGLELLRSERSLNGS